MADELLTEDEVAKWLRCSRKTVRRRPIPYAKMGGQRRYKREDVQAFIEASTVRPAPDPEPQPPNEPAQPRSSPQTGNRGRRPAVQLAADELKEALALTARLRAEQGKARPRRRRRRRC